MVDFWGTCFEVDCPQSNEIWLSYLSKNLGSNTFGLFGPTFLFTIGEFTRRTRGETSGKEASKELKSVNVTRLSVSRHPLVPSYWKLIDEVENGNKLHHRLTESRPTHSKPTREAYLWPKYRQKIKRFSHQKLIDECGNRSRLYQS